MTKRTATIALLAASALQAAAAIAGDSTLQRLDAQRTSSRRLLTTMWANPAVMPLLDERSLSHVHAGTDWQRAGDAGAFDPQQGTGHTVWQFDAGSYMKHRSSTLWGHASYHNGTTRNVVWNESSDLATVYPYVLADSIGGSMKQERYSFSGGWADTFGRWHLGAQMGYDAGLYYRDVDPRPRNVTARLDARVGTGYQLTPSATVAAFVAFEKYKQTNEVTFFSDLGSRQLLHLTGLANHYSRFAGTGLNTYYKGHSWQAGANAVVGKRLWLAAVGTHQQLENIISDLNNLPMARVSHNALEAEAAAMPISRLTLVARASWARRVGRENVFADAQSGTYPQIASHDRYFANAFDASLQAQCDVPLSRVLLQALPQVAYEHSNQMHASSQSRTWANRLGGGATLRGTWNGGSTRLSAQVGADYSNATSHGMVLPAGTADTAPLLALERHLHELAIGSQVRSSAKVAASRMIAKGFAAHIELQWQHTAYAHSYKQDAITATVGVVF